MERPLEFYPTDSNAAAQISEISPGLTLGSVPCVTEVVSSTRSFLEFGNIFQPTKITCFFADVHLT